MVKGATDTATSLSLYVSCGQLSLIPPFLQDVSPTIFHSYFGCVRSVAIASIGKRFHTKLLVKVQHACALSALYGCFGTATVSAAGAKVYGHRLLASRLANGFAPAVVHSRTAPNDVCSGLYVKLRLHSN